MILDTKVGEEPEDIVVRVEQAYGVPSGSLDTRATRLDQQTVRDARDCAAYLMRRAGWPWKTAAAFCGFAGLSGAHKGALRHCRRHGLDGRLVRFAAVWTILRDAKNPPTVSEGGI